MCPHQPRCPEWPAPDHLAARIGEDQPRQGWSLLCNGVIEFDDGGELLPDGRAVTPDRRGLSHPALPDSAGDRNYLLVLEALSALPAEQRAVVIETFYNRHGVATAAELLDIPADIVKARCYAALRSLKDALTHRGTLR